MTDQEMAKELALWCINDGLLYRQTTQSIIKNYAIKKVKGIYDPKRAIVRWLTLVEEELVRYKKKFPGYYRIDKTTKVAAAKMVENYYRNELEDKAVELYDLKKAGKAWQRGK
jgi:hypothetical protein